MTILACTASIAIPVWQRASEPRAEPAVAATIAVATVPAVPTAPAYGPCRVSKTESVRRAADHLLAGRYTLARFRTFTLPRDLRWDENPAGDPNWEFNLHTLRFADALWGAWEMTGDRRYHDRYESTLRDWYEDNPRTFAPSRFSWNDHATAWRGIVYACALRRLPHRPWLGEAALLHGRTLADETFFVDRGNHALNQAIGLLALGCEMRREAWKTLAVRRIEKLVVGSVDGQGATNEQAVGYQWYNFVRYSAAAAHMRDCGITPSRALTTRVARMPEFLAFGALPDRRWELIGDTVAGGLDPVPGTIAEFVATRGLMGPKPELPYAVFDAGFAFLRSGWGEDRPLADETAISLRFGPARAFHGHRDAAAITLYTGGDRVLLDPGMYHYKRDAWRAWFRSGPAHNTIEVAGRQMAEAGATQLVARRHSAAFDFLAVRNRKIPGVDHRRRVLYSRRLDVLLVEDDVRMRTPGTVRQWWHLHPDARPHVDEDGFFTGRRGSRANAWVVQLGGDAAHTVVRGGRDPIQGWVSFDYGKLAPAPAVAVIESGTRVRYFTLIVPSVSRGRGWSVRSFVPRSEGFDLVMQVGNATERIWIRGTDAATRAL